MGRLLRPCVFIAICAILALAQAPEAQGGKSKGGGKGEKHPNIEAAIKALEKAKAELQKASHDFGGHKVSAIGAADTAITELKAALAAAPKTKPKKGKGK